MLNALVKADENKTYIDDEGTQFNIMVGNTSKFLLYDTLRTNHYYVYVVENYSSNLIEQTKQQL